MARWMVSRNDGSQEPVDGLAGLKELARAGRLAPADMVQPPGTNEWMYASEIEEIAGELKNVGASADLDDFEYKSSGGAMRAVLSVIFLSIFLGAAYKANEFFNKIPTDAGTLLDNFSYSEMIVTGEEVKMRSQPDNASAVVAPVPNGEALELLSKRGEFYRARMKKGGSEGWVPVDQVMPMYMLGGKEVMRERDPLYNPDRYLTVGNASWMQLPEQRAARITVFQFALRNSSRYDMTDVVMVATIKDSKGHDLEKVEFHVDGVVPSSGATMVGTIVNDKADESKGELKRRLITEATFKTLSADDPDLALMYNAGAEVKMTTEDFTEATIDIVELRAVPRE